MALKCIFAYLHEYSRHSGAMCIKRGEDLRRYVGKIIIKNKPCIVT